MIRLWKSSIKGHELHRRGGGPIWDTLHPWGPTGIINSLLPKDPALSSAPAL